MEIAIDSSVLVGLLVPNDLWHTQAVALWKAIKAAGYDYIGSVYYYDKNKADWDLRMVFRRKGESEKQIHAFKGLSWGYHGEGPRGLMEVSDIFGLNLDKSKVLGDVDTGLPEKGEITLEDFK